MNKIVMILSIICFALMAGCNNNNEARKNEENEFIQVKNQVIEKDDPRSSEEIAQNLVKLASSVPNVNDATALVIGNVAVVGIDVNSKIDRSRVGTIKYSVAESLKHDPHGANAIVIADPDANVRLRQMGKEIKQGRPISGIMNELSAMVGRLMPELPADIFEQDRTAPTETNSKNQLPEGKENELEKEQQDQSKNQKNRDTQTPKNNL
ncbi:YhcN/YlaJ family sporulation lipoprotein [Bacillus suaedaesalsae]|uniref:YhcN/YlaJ family sporulation lipoprotein n=1 Tax=Bacillus suaedaesalsae TaxID=2810349 RepID=A0ABS2DJP2_9BACI|nr:YhcN/YlaJ family sporulation lipoprotein [Bacillus suaedaesalsae]MBM6618601.1 YhcN/YlaJ family sporulation lipoprotein [Bacillus suaedaesalsae]